ncbi:hypothetical protein [Deminuibacter soli]|uniref:Copper chaperone n=1 Tax=Deminuibacter soli TaxID=2291815 RepID=A0A3E1NPL3_9BACT|nr:hypothetical protein [Deminuibacter soli]RFM29850.1 hypothetical protein DXN05_02425 [Deminuibacter soli]
MNILVFKTSLENRQQVKQAGSFLKQLAGIVRWNVDLHDEDYILRIVTPSLSPRLVEQHLQQAGYYCRELED